MMTIRYGEVIGSCLLPLGTPTGEELVHAVYHFDSHMGYGLAGAFVVLYVKPGIPLRFNFETLEAGVALAVRMGKYKDVLAYYDWSVTTVFKMDVID
jgi:hypothetical protein